MSIPCQGADEHGQRLRRRFSVTQAGADAGWVAFAFVLFACGETASDPTDRGLDGSAAQGAGVMDRDEDAATSASQGGSDRAGAGGGRYPGQPGSGERLRAEAPACEGTKDGARSPARAGSNLTTVEVLTGEPLRTIWSRTSFDARVVARGSGVPDGAGELPYGFEASEALAWLRLERPARPNADAGVAEGTDVVSWFILGPSELALLPATADDELHVELDRAPYPFYLTPNWKLEVTSNGRLLILDENRGLGAAAVESGGMGFERGAPHCQSSDECFYYYEHALQVTAPDGTSATLNPHSSVDAGGYRIFHGNTGSTSVVEAGIDVNNFCADRSGPWNASTVTAILLPIAD